MGQTRYGNRVEVDPLAVGRKVIVVSGTVHHLMAGYGGGRKSILPGISSRATIRRNHSMALDLSLIHISAITNPLVNSYKRLVPGYEAPCYLAWSASNRSALIRIPAARGQATRVELRCPDPTCNPYLALAVCLAAGLDGIEKGLTPPEEVTDLSLIHI